MREIIVIQVGGAGNKIGAKFWELISDEHGINFDTGKFEGESDLQKERLNVYFTETMKGCDRFVPRSINVDLDANSINTTKNTPIGSLFKPNNFIAGKESGSNNFAKGRYGSHGKTVIDPTMDAIQKCAEACDHIQGFQIIHAIGGGAGSGVTSHIMDHLIDEYTDDIFNTFSVIPSMKTSEIVVENYNAIFSLSHLTDSSDETILVDNEALINISRDVLQVKGNMNDFNLLISECIAGVSACFRFPGQLNMDLRKLAVNMTPYPRLHFFTPSFVPLFGRFQKCYMEMTVPTLVGQMFDPRFMQVACDPTKGKYLCATAIFRGMLSLSEIQECLYAKQNKNSKLFDDIIPDTHVSAADCDIAPRGLPMACTFLTNTTAISQVFERCLSGFSIMLKRKANIHWYLAEGMEESEFHQAETDIRELCESYRAEK